MWNYIKLYHTTLRLLMVFLIMNGMKSTLCGDLAQGPEELDNLIDVSKGTQNQEDELTEGPGMLSEVSGELAQGPDAPQNPGFLWSLPSYISSGIAAGFDKIKAMTSAGMKAGKEVTRVQTLKLLNYLIPNFSQQIRTIKKALDSSSTYINTIEKTLEIPENASSVELDSAVAHLRSQLKPLQEKQRELQREAIRQQNMPKVDKSKATPAKIGVMDNMSKIFARNIAERLRALDARAAQRSAHGKQAMAQERQDIEQAISNIEAAPIFQEAAQRRDRLKHAFATGNFDSDLITPEQQKRSGVEESFWKQLEAERTLVIKNEIKKRVAAIKSKKGQEAENLRKELANRLTNGIYKLQDFTPEQLQETGLDEAFLKKIQQESNTPSRSLAGTAVRYWQNSIAGGQFEDVD